MKLRIYFRPYLVLIALLAATAIALTSSYFVGGPWNWIFVAAGCFYVMLSAIALVSLLRTTMLERWIEWDKPERLLIVAPHQDDCVICAGGVGVRNARLGGATQIVYLVQEEDEAVARRRLEEMNSAWALAGVSPEHLIHLNLLPALRKRDPAKLVSATAALRNVIEKFAPSVIVMPMFEGGHIHHDMANHVMSSILTTIPGVVAYESPEYSPYLSLRWTPHRILSLCGRWLFGLVAYYGPPDGVDSRTIWKVRLTSDELRIKRQMLAAVVSQNGASLARTRSYPDRLVLWSPKERLYRPFSPENSYLSFVSALGRMISIKWAARLFPVQVGTIGREPGITDLRDELA
jgi:LmbE family N-acetylglucosaminyl deacetylase